MAHWRAKPAVLIALLVLAGALAWYVLSPGSGAVPLPPEASEARETGARAPGNASPTEFPPGRTDVLAPLAAARSGADGAWVIQGRITFAPFFGVSIDELLDQDDRTVLVQCLNFSKRDADLQQWYFSPGPQFSFEVPREELDPANSGWFVGPHFRSDEYADGLPLQIAARATPRPERDAVAGLRVPVIRGNVIDLGEIRIDLAALARPPVLLTGRLVHSTGVTLTTPAGFALAAQSPGIWFSEYGRADFEGRFAIIAYGATLSDQCSWTFLDGLDAEYPIQPPVHKDGHAMFGDIVLNGPMLDVRIRTPGVPDLPADPMRGLSVLRDNEPCATISLGELSGASPLKLRLPPAPARFLVPEGRYFYDAEVRRPDFVAPILSGLMLPRPGSCTELVLTFVPESAVLLSVLDPQGRPASAHVHWTIFNGERDMVLSGYCDGLRVVPTRPGCVTRVVASAPDFEDIEQEVTFDASSVVMRFEERRREPRVDFVMPELAGAETGRCLEMWLIAEYVGSDGKARHDKWVAEAKAGERAIRQVDLRPWFWGRRASVWLTRSGEASDPKLTDPVQVEMPADGVVRVELPELTVPPGTFTADIVDRPRCAGAPAGVEGTLEFTDGSRNKARIYDGGLFNRLVWFNAAGPVEGERVPVAFLAGQQRIPVSVRAPAAGEVHGSLALDLPVRLQVSVTVHGRRVHEFAAHARPENDGDVQCTAGTESGVAQLWCPPGPARVDVTVRGERRTWAGSVVVPEWGVADVDVRIDTHQVALRRPRDNRAGEGGRWDMMNADKSENMAPTCGWGEAVYVPAGRYWLVPHDPRLKDRAFEVEISRDREVVLPELPAIDIATLLLRVSASEWRDLTGFGFSYYLDVPEPQPSRGFRIGYNEDWPFQDEEFIEGSNIRMVPDGIRLKGLPVGRKIHLRGWAYVDEDRKDVERMLKPVTITLKAENTVDASWVRPIALGQGWDPHLAVMDEFPGHALPFRTGVGVLSGRHTLALLINKKEVFRHAVTVPEKAEPFDVPADLLRKIEEAKERANPPDE